MTSVSPLYIYKSRDPTSLVARLQQRPLTGPSMYNNTLAMNVTYSDTSISITFSDPYYTLDASPTHVTESDLPLPCNHNPDGTLCDVCREIEDVEAQIKAIASPLELEELHERHRALRSKRNDLCLVGRLPYDIVSRIFILALPPIIREFVADYEPPCPDFVTPRLPLRLSAVCALWRHLAHSIPQLWSTLSIDICQTNLEHVNHRLQCSGSVPLRVRLSAPRDASISPSPHILALITLVKQNLHRMALLCVNLPCQFIKEFFSQDSNIPQALPILKELHFHCSLSGFRGMCAEPHSFVLSVDPPSPHKVHVTSTSLTNIELNWDAVRHLSLETTKSSHPSILGAVLPLLSKSSQLNVVDFFFFPDPPSPPAAMMVIQNSIRVLRLFHMSEKVLAHVTLPHVESLKLWQLESDPTNPLLSFLQRSACPLHTMVWKPTQLASLEQVFIDLFKCTPKLKRLALDVTAPLIDQESEAHVVPFLEHLSNAEGSSEPFLPLLQEFVYTGPAEHAPLSLFLDIAERRFESTTSTPGRDRAIRPLEGLTVFRFQQDEELEPLAEADWQRILELNAVRERFAVLEYDVSCEMTKIDCSAYYS